MQEIDMNSSVGMMHVYQILPAPANWYAKIGPADDVSLEAIAAFGLIDGPCGKRTRLVGLLPTDNELMPVDCYTDYRDTVYIP